MFDLIQSVEVCINAAPDLFWHLTRRLGLTPRATTHASQRSLKISPLFEPNMMHSKYSYSCSNITSPPLKGQRSLKYFSCHPTFIDGMRQGLYKWPQNLLHSYWDINSRMFSFQSRCDLRSKECLNLYLTSNGHVKSCKIKPIKLSNYLFKPFPK